MISDQRYAPEAHPNHISEHKRKNWTTDRQTGKQTDTQMLPSPLSPCYMIDKKQIAIVACAACSSPDKVRSYNYTVVKKRNSPGVANNFFRIIVRQFFYTHFNRENFFCSFRAVKFIF